MSEPPPSYDDAQKSTIYPESNTMPAPNPPYNPSQQTPNMSSQPPMHTTPTVIYIPECQTYGPRGMNMTCPHCRNQIQSEVKYTSGLLAWIICGVCLLFGCWLGCCLIPFCIDDCKDAEHFCPACKAYLGQYKRIS